MYTFHLTKNVHMYCHELICRNGDHEYRCIVESSPYFDNTIVFWADHLDVPPGNSEQLLIDLELWAKDQPFKYLIYWKNDLIAKN